MLIDVGPEPRSPYGPDPVERARVRQSLRHVQLRALQHALGQPERDPVDEQALPELERGGRRDVEAREVGQVAAEGFPALGLDLRGRRAPAPEAAVERGDHERGGVHEPAGAERDLDDAAPASARPS